MGIDPNDTFTYWLPADRSKPESERRGLVYLHGTSAHWRRFSADLKAAVKHHNDEYFEAITELCRRGLQAWIGFDRPFDGALEEILTDGGIIELSEELRATSALSELEKKRLWRQSMLAAASSAPDAAAENVTK
jgi:hypothetical protein